MIIFYFFVNHLLILKAGVNNSIHDNPKLIKSIVNVADYELNAESTHNYPIENNIGLNSIKFNTSLLK